MSWIFLKETAFPAAFAAFGEWACSGEVAWMRPQRSAGVKNRTTPQSVKIPLFRYFMVVGGLLVSILFVADAYLPTTRIDPDSKSAPKPTILIASSIKWPERIVYDTNLPTTLALVPEESAVVPSPPPPALNSMAQLITPTPPRAAAHPYIVKKKRVKIARRVYGPRFVFNQNGWHPDSFGAWW
jgi:hypothetical protein